MANNCSPLSSSVAPLLLKVNIAMTQVKRQRNIFESFGITRSADEIKEAETKRKKAKRARDLKIYGSTQQTEDRALKHLFSCLEGSDFVAKKTFNGCTYDFSVHVKGKEESALGIQIKSCSRGMKSNPNTAMFSDVKYDPWILLLLVRLDNKATWWRWSHHIKSDSGKLHITSGGKEDKNRVRKGRLPSVLEGLLCEAEANEKTMSLEKIHTTFRSDDMAKEYNGTMLLKEHLALQGKDLVVNDRDATTVDAFLGEERLQLKTAGETDSSHLMPYKANFEKQIGTEGGQRKRGPYSASDFDFAIVTLLSPDEKELLGYWKIPMADLVSLGKDGVTPAKTVSLTHTKLAEATRARFKQKSQLFHDKSLGWWVGCCVF